MRQYLVDTNILSFYLKGHQAVKDKLIDKIDIISTSIISFYEVMSGLQSIQAEKRISEFEEFCKLIEIINLDKASISASCKIYADLKHAGNLIDDIDILIAGVALSNNLVFVTDNIRHFDRIKNLKVENWRE